MGPSQEALWGAGTEFNDATEAPALVEFPRQNACRVCETFFWMSSGKIPDLYMMDLSFGNNKIVFGDIKSREQN